MGSPKAAIPLHLIQPTGITNSPPTRQDAVAHCSTASTSKETDRRFQFEKDLFWPWLHHVTSKLWVFDPYLLLQQSLCSLMVVTGCVHCLWWDDGILVIWAISLYVSRVRTPKRFKIHKCFIFIDGTCLAKRRPCLQGIRFCLEAHLYKYSPENLHILYKEASSKGNTFFQPSFFRFHFNFWVCKCFFIETIVAAECAPSFRCFVVFLVCFCIERRWPKINWNSVGVVVYAVGYFDDCSLWFLIIMVIAPTLGVYVFFIIMTTLFSSSWLSFVIFRWLRCSVDVESIFYPCNMTPPVCK